MNSTLLQEITDVVRRLSAAELAAFRSWFHEFDAELWDRQFEADVSAGRLDWLADETRRELRDGLCTDR